ncbi:MAG: hydantoinase/oxoprolinase family protein [Rhizobiales bacterium]|nr:hydantoinase/oxoprolinase family protein [Hyphomicrobiales bacterium]
MSKSNIILGIDTGGTYTDAAVIDAGIHRILASAKSITTKGNLALGVGGAMKAAVDKLAGSVKPGDIRLVCVSTTLATNAVVEGHGNAAGVILIGFDDAMAAKTGIANAFPGIPIARIAGGHDHNGDAVRPLDVAALTSAIETMSPQVTAFAIASAFAVRNNAHETAARDLIAKMTGKPVTVSSELSNALDAPRRALTALLNARLISRITHLIEAVRAAMDDLGIKGGLMVVKGDGTLASAETVALRPIETVLSGPAASLVGAKWLAGCDDFILSDIGGTTTDVAILAGGRPMVAPQGAEVGGWRTMVKAIDVKTIGLGGDSEVQLDGLGKLIIGPQRAVPVALLAARYPVTEELLDADLAETDGGSMLGKFLVRPFGDKGGASAGVTEREAEILARIGDGPVPLRRVAVSSAAQRTVASLRRKGLLQYCCFTPSDSALVLGLQDNWPASAAVKAARLMARFRMMKMPDDSETQDFCRDVWHKTVSLSARIILETAMGPKDKASAAWDAVCDGNGRVGLARISLSPSVPIVAVGGPAKVYYEEVARRLDCEVIFAPFCDVANAVGAAAGQVADKVTLSVEGDGNGAFRIHGDGGTHLFGSGTMALAEALKIAEAQALSQARARGAVDPKVTISVEKNLLPDARDDDGLLTALITAEAIGQPAG